MDAHYWLQLWHHQHQPGFDQRQVNPFLLRHYSTTLSQTPQRIFIPLCGQSIDMHWLWQQGHDIHAVEISEKAVLHFFAKYALPYTVSAFTQKGLMIYQTERLKIVVGDYFSLDLLPFGELDWVYDRAAMVAFPKNRREEYVTQLLKIAGIKAKIWLLSLHYVAQEEAGPPFSLELDEIKQRFRGYDIREIDREVYNKHKVEGVSELSEVLYVLQRCNNLD